jgi:hypothetical protein
VRALDDEETAMLQVGRDGGRDGGTEGRRDGGRKEGGRARMWMQGGGKRNNVCIKFSTQKTSSTIFQLPLTPSLPPTLPPSPPPSLPLLLST